MTKRRAGFLAICGALAIGLALLLVFHAGVRGTVLDPIIRAFVTTRYLINSLHQALLWALLILTASLLVFRAWPRRPTGRRRTTTGGRSTQGESEWTLIRLAELLRKSSQRRSARAGIVRVLADTAVHLIARHYGISLPTARERLTRMDWTDQQEIAAFLATRTLSEAVPRKGFEERVHRTIEYLESYYQEV